MVSSDIVKGNSFDLKHDPVKDIKKKIVHDIMHVADLVDSMMGGQGVEMMRSLVEDTNVLERMRSYVEEGAKLYFTDQSAGVTINLWLYVFAAIALLICKSLQIIFKF